jgi:protein-L-isoaspartate(D-aspartate) O-methyltransferase
MVAEQIENRGVTDARILAVMRAVPRHLFVPEESRDQAYEDYPVSIGHEQTISQPYIVAYMTAAIGPRPSDRVLEIGTGSGYQTAVLAGLVREVLSVEIRPGLADRARHILEAVGCGNVRVRLGDGSLGWPEESPFDAILVTAAPESVPTALLKQLAPGGRMVIPLGAAGWDAQRLVRLTRMVEDVRTEVLLPVRFVPLTSEEPRPH